MKHSWTEALLVLSMCSFAFAQAIRPPAIASISVCSANGPGGPGSCPSGIADTHQIVLGPGGGSVNASNLGVGAAPDEHSSVFAPGTLGNNQDYLFFLASQEGGHAAIGMAVLSGGPGPDKNGQWTLDFPRTDGYGSYSSGFGQVFNPSTKGGTCPVVADGNPAHQDQTFDMHYAAGGSVVKDPTAAPGALLMVYEGTNACIGNAGGPILNTSNDYISLGIATSLDYGKSWPAYRGTSSFSFVPMPGVNVSQAPNAPMGSLGKNVCIGNDCTTPPPASYGRYPVVTTSPSLASLMALATPLTAKTGEQEISGFVDDIAGGPAPYLYANWGGMKVGRAQLNGGSAPLSFQKWNGLAFASTGMGGAESSVLPAGAFENCEAPAQTQFGSSISYVEDTQQYLLTFLCVSAGDPALGKGAGGSQGAAWFYSTSYDLSDQSQWTPPAEITGSWSVFDPSGGCPSWKGYYPTFVSLGQKPAHLSTSGYVFYLWGCQGGGSPAPARQFSARAFTITTAQPCSYTFSSGGQAFPSQGGTGSIAITTAPNCRWTVGVLPPWVTLTSPPSGFGNGTVTFQVFTNAGSDLSGSFTIAGQVFTVEQTAASMPALAAAGSLGQVASEGTWDFSLVGINLGASTSTARFTFTDNNGNPLMLPLTFPQLAPAAGPELASTLDRTLNPNAQIVMESTGPDSAATLVGSGQLLSNGSVSGFGIFSNPKVHWNAVVPLETRNASKYILAFDNTGPLTTGVAVASLGPQAANVAVILRDDAGTQLGAPAIPLSAMGHTSFMLDPPPQGFPATKGKRGTIEFDTPPGGQLSVLGLRANGPALTTLPVLANVGTTGGSITHVAFNGGWTSVFYIVNTGTTSAQFTLSFADENGVALAVPLLLPQSSTSTTTSALTRTLAPGAMLVVTTQAQDAQALVIGSAQLSTTGNVGGFEIFRWNTFGQEASVPLESRTPNSFILVFDDTNGLTTGVALASTFGLQANITVTFRDDTGAQIGVPQTITLAAHGHTSFLLPDRFPAAAGKRGMVEFTAPPGQGYSVIGLRARSSDGTLTTIPVLVK